MFTTVTIGEAQYSIKKFDAKTGMKIARMLIAKAAPILPMLEKSGNQKEDDGALFAALGSMLDTLSDADVDNLVDKCLRVCYLNLPAGPAAVIDETGQYGVEGVEYDMMLTLRLCIEAIKWGASDFFGEKSSGLKQILAQIGSSQNP